MSNLCSDEPILDSKQLYNTIENSQNTLRTEKIIRTDTKEHISGHEYEYQYYVVNGTILSGVTDHSCSNLVEKLVIIGAGADKLVM